MKTPEAEGALMAIPHSSFLLASKYGEAQPHLKGATGAGCGRSRSSYASTGGMHSCPRACIAGCPRSDPWRGDWACSAKKTFVSAGKRGKPHFQQWRTSACNGCETQLPLALQCRWTCTMRCSQRRTGRRRKRFCVF